MLARRQGEILSKTAIAELVWDMNFDSNTNVVEVAIKRLRAKIDGAVRAASLLHTIRGMGYVLEPRDERRSGAVRQLDHGAPGGDVRARRAGHLRADRRGAATRVLERELTRHQDDELDTNLQNMQLLDRAHRHDSTAGPACRPRWTR